MWFQKATPTTIQVSGQTQSPWHFRRQFLATKQDYEGVKPVNSLKKLASYCEGVKLGKSLNSEQNGTVTQKFAAKWYCAGVKLGKSLEKLAAKRYREGVKLGKSLKTWQQNGTVRE
jgi:hypothetical protein